MKQKLEKENSEYKMVIDDLSGNIEVTVKSKVRPMLVLITTFWFCRLRFEKLCHSWNDTLWFQDKTRWKHLSDYWNSYYYWNNQKAKLCNENGNQQAWIILNTTMKTEALFSYCFLESLQHVRFLIFLRRKKLSSRRHWELNGPLLSKLRNWNGGTGRLSKNLRFVTIPPCYGERTVFTIDVFFSFSLWLFCASVRQRTPFQAEKLW